MESSLSGAPLSPVRLPHGVHVSLITLFVYSIWALFAHTGILLPSFTHLNIFDVLSSVKHKGRSFKECSCCSFPYNENGWGLKKDKKKLHRSIIK